MVRSNEQNNNNLYPTFQIKIRTQLSVDEMRYVFQCENGQKNQANPVER